MLILRVLLSPTFTFIIIILIFLQIYLQNKLGKSMKKQNFSGNVILWWTPFTLQEKIYQTCGDFNCLFTNNRKYITHKNLKALMFYGSRFNISDLPNVPRNNTLWGLFHEESPRNIPLLSHEPILSLFNYSSTFSRYSDFPITLQYLVSLDNITDKSLFVPVEMKNKFQSEGVAPIIYLQSDCVTPLNRDSYVKELMKYIKIDSYGQCLNNQNLPQHLSDPMSTMMSKDLIHFISKYKFSIAFENAQCYDYVTEKLWRPLIAGSVPIYFGSKTVKDWLPNNLSAILVENFESPKSLAEFLLKLNKDDYLYMEFLKHKIKSKVENQFLLKQSSSRNWKADDENSFIREFECLMCAKSYSDEVSVISKNHYNCPQPVSIVSKQRNYSNWWHDDWIVSKCQAAIIRNFINRNKQINLDQIKDIMKNHNIEISDCDKLSINV